MTDARRPDPGSALRAAAARALTAIFAGRSADDALAAAESGFGDADRALLRAVVYGVLRERRLLEALLYPLLREPARTPAQIRALLLVGAVQLRSLRVPAHAAVSATVAAAPAPARGLVNAVLRRFQREGAAMEARLPVTAALRQSYPDWTVAQIRRDWPDSWRKVLTAGNEPAPMTLRVNRRRGSRDDYLARLRQAGIDAEPLPGLPDALRLAKPQPVGWLPGFAEGAVSVQDAAAQRAAALLQARPGQRVLDACAAPGGKSAHLLEQVDDLALLAIDVDADRQQRTRQTLERLGLGAQVVAGDALRPQDWWDGQPFQRILLDAPCSGSGVIRRHPDIKWLRRQSDIPALAHRQRGLLDALWPLLAPGGVLLYATCSIFDVEGAAVVEAFLAGHPDAAERPFTDADWGEPARAGRRLAPGVEVDGNGDGFYYARIVKVNGEQ